MKRIFLLVLLAFSFVGNGCKSNAVEPTPAVSGVLYPLAVGNTWVVQSTTYRFDGAVIETYFDTTRVIASITINGETWYVQQFTSSRGSSVTTRDTVTFRTTEASQYAPGIWLHAAALGGEAPFYIYPGAVGFGWQAGRISFRIDNNDLTENLPIGVFQHCYEYELSYTNLTTMKYDILAPSVGFVKSTTYDSLQSPPSVYVSKREDLKSYTVK